MASDLLLRAEARAELERRRCRREPEYFIRQYVKIEDKDAPGGVTSFDLWPAQQTALDAFATQRLVVVLKARQLGLTWLALAYALWRAVFTPAYSVTALSKTDDDAKELVRRVKFIAERLPPWMLRPAGGSSPVPTWDSTTHSVTVAHPGAVEARFKALPAAEDAGRSLTASLLLIDEWAFQQWADPIWSAAYPSINRPGGGQVIGLSTGRRGTLYESVWNGAQAGSNGFAPVFLPWSADPRRTAEWYEATKLALPNAWRAEYPTAPEDAFTAGEGAFFQEWDPSVHVTEPWSPPEQWARYRVYDPGFSSRACCKWYAVSPDGCARAYREYYPQRVTDDQQAEEIKRLSVLPDGRPEEIALDIADPAAWQAKSNTGKSTADEFTERGIYLTKADNGEDNGWRRLHQWLRPFTGSDGQPTALLTFTRDCRNTIRTYPSVLPNKTNPEKVADTCEHHPQDVDRYFVMSRPLPAAIPDPPKGEVARHIDRIIAARTEERHARGW